ncbi:geranylgeranyl diphosphate synthase, type I [Lentzea albidocapillata subsp. violacea]|uniref:Geranylgeranyl diphosphate synthase, type I n=1 Tax=Lentzea albidocapillata subsp. violacea TaxID=128104 RepID=A0A1G9PJP9_9PSEU|nr:polyprenyl synthetase family protein [Lentzea albidocapillata]SDL98437.1 geranylgeranyl diphosphate synthase, type I [Lentzea albidocapillata subsp. violacea]
MTSIDLVAPPRHVLERTRAAVGPLLPAALAELPDETREVVEFGLARQDFSTAALVLLSAEAFGDADVAVVALALEFAHLHEQLHADLMSRGGAWEAFGADRVVSAADALLSLALARLTTPQVMILNVALMSVVDGYVQEIGMAEEDDVDLAQHLGVAAAKHSSLTAAACELGALAAGASASQAGHLRQFGDDIGLARKHVDDVLALHDDIAHGRRTLPVVAAANSGMSVGGGRKWCEQQAELLLARALNHLRQCGPRARAAEELTALAREVTTARCAPAVPAQPTGRSTTLPGA